MKVFEKISQLGRGTFNSVLDLVFPRDCLYCEGSRKGGGIFYAAFANRK